MDKVLQIYGRSFDDTQKFINALAYMNSVNYNIHNDIPSQLLKNLSETLGWKTNISPITNEDFLDSVIGGTEYSDINNYYSGDLSWPHWTEPNYDDRGRGDGPPARSFSDAVGYNIQVSGSYHGQRQKPNHFLVEPDSSLRATSNKGGEGWEFVSPPLSIPDMVDVIKKVAAWAKLYFLS